MQQQEQAEYISSITPQLKAAIATASQVYMQSFPTGNILQKCIVSLAITCKTFLKTSSLLYSVTSSCQPLLEPSCNACGGS
jgi:hypothetical protein